MRVGVRVNSVYSSYRMSANAFSQRFGDLAGPSLPTLTGLTFTVISVNSSRPETVRVPYIASFLGQPFTDGPSLYVSAAAHIVAS